MYVITIQQRYRETDRRADDILTAIPLYARTCFAR